MWAVHEYYGHAPGFLPPNLVGYDDNGAGAGAGAAWLALAAAGLWVVHRARQHHTGFGTPRPA